MKRVWKQIFLGIIIIIPLTLFVFFQINRYFEMHHLVAKDTPCINRHQFYFETGCLILEGLCFYVAAHPLSWLAMKIVLLIIPDKAENFSQSILE